MLELLIVALLRGRAPAHTADRGTRHAAASSMMAMPMMVMMIAGSLAMIATEAFADRVTIAERPDHVTEGTVTVDASPAEVYALVTDYARWRSVLTDIKSVTVKSGGRRDAKVRFSSRALEHEVTVEFDNEADRTIRFRGIQGPPGGRARGQYVLQPVDGGKRTLVTASLYMDVVGLAGVFVRDASIRAMRQAKLRADLTDVAQYFAKRRVSSSQASQS